MTATAFQTNAEGQLTGLKVAKVGPDFKALEGTEQVN